MYVCLCERERAAAIKRSIRFLFSLSPSLSLLPVRFSLFPIGNLNSIIIHILSQFIFHRYNFSTQFRNFSLHRRFLVVLATLVLSRSRECVISVFTPLMGLSIYLYLQTQKCFIFWSHCWNWTVLLKTYFARAAQSECECQARHKNKIAT